MANNIVNANAAEDKGIVKSWSLLAFRNEFGKMQLGDFKDKEGTPFRSCVFSKEDANGEMNRTFVAFSSKLDHIPSGKELADNHDSYNVVKLTSGTYKLCLAGQGSWEDVNF